MIEAMKQALEALEICAVRQDHQWHGLQQVSIAKAALRQAIEQAEKQEPVAWMWRCKPYCDWPNWSVSLKRPADSGRDGHERTEGYEDIPLYTTPQPQQDAWKNAAIRLGEELSSVGPDGYYNMTAEQWLSWALDQQPNGKNSLPQPQREWVGLTDEDIALVCAECAASAHNWDDISFARAIEAKLKEKNT